MKPLSVEEQITSAGLLALAMRESDALALSRWAVQWGSRWMATVENEVANRKDQVRRKRVGQSIFRHMREAQRGPAN